MIGRLYVHFVPVYRSSVSHWIGPLCLHTLYITVYMHVKRITLYILMHSHNLSLVEKCVIKLSYFA